MNKKTRRLNQAFADRMNRLTPEEVARAMESLPTDVLEWAVRFEALSCEGEWESDLERDRRNP